MKTFTVLGSRVEYVTIESNVLADYKKQIKDRETVNARLLDERDHNRLCLSMLYKKCSDLEAKNAYLVKRNEESLKEVENQYKIVKQLQDRCASLNTQLDIATHTAQLLREEKSKIAVARYRDLEIIEELREYSTELARAALKQDIESVPKSKFVITVEEV